MSRPPKLANLLEVVRKHIEEEKYLYTAHATERQVQRSITIAHALYVIRYGWHEKDKDSFKAVYKTWNYSIRGKDADKRELRVIVSFDEEDLLIITVMAVGQ